MPGRIFSTLSFYIYSEVCSSEEFKKYFATPLRPPLAGLFQYMVRQVYLYRLSKCRYKANAFTLIIGNMGIQAACG
jgi:hypothetical protein